MKAFAVLIIVTAAVGGGIGGAIIMATGSDSNDNAVPVVTTQENFPTPTRSQAPTSNSTATNTGTQSQVVITSEPEQENATLSAEELQQLREKLQSGLQSGDLTSEELAEIRGKLQAHFRSQSGGTERGNFNFERVSGTVLSVTDSTVTVKTETGQMTASINSDTTFRITTLLQVTGNQVIDENLEEGKNVTAIIERGEGGTNIAQTLVIQPENSFTSGQNRAAFPGRGGQGGGGGFRGGAQTGRGSGRSGEMAQAGNRPLIGSVVSTDTDSVVLETQLGQLKVTINETTTIVTRSEGTIEDIVEGDQVMIVGPREENGSINANSISNIPDGADEITGLGLGGRGSGRRGNGGDGF